MAIHFEVESKLGKKIRVTKKYWDYIVAKHESVRSLEEEIKETLKNPITIKMSKEDPKVCLYYTRYRKYYLCAVCKHLNQEGFLITAYLADKIKKGMTIL